MSPNVVEVLFYAYNKHFIHFWSGIFTQILSFILQNIHSNIVLHFTELKHSISRFLILNFKISSSINTRIQSSKWWYFESFIWPFLTHQMLLKCCFTPITSTSSTFGVEYSHILDADFIPNTAQIFHDFGPNQGSIIWWFHPKSRTLFFHSWALNQRNITLFQRYFTARAA